MARNIIVDIEAANGPTPFSGVMTDFGAVDLASEKTFYGHLIDYTPHPENPAIPVIDKDYVEKDRFIIMSSFQKWLNSFNDDRLIFISDNPAFDFMWIAYYFDSVGMKNPFGYSGRRIGDIFAGSQMAEGKKWVNVQKWKKWRKTQHTHNPLDDAMGNMEGLKTLLEKYNQTF